MRREIIFAGVGCRKKRYATGADMADTNLKFLVVDDFSTMRCIVRNLLMALGWANVADAEDGVDALQKLRNAPFDFVMSDSNKRNVTSIELQERLVVDRYA